MDYASVYGGGGGGGGAAAVAAAGGAEAGGAGETTVSVDWGEARTYINDIIMLYESDTEEAKVLAQIKQLRADIAAIATSREADARKVITGKLLLLWWGLTAVGHRRFAPTRPPTPPLQSCWRASAAWTRTRRR